MFDIGFWELVLVGLMALLVFGPEKLPRVAREAALWVRKARTMVSSVKEEIDRELELQELKETLASQKKLLESRIEEVPPTGASKPPHPDVSEPGDEQP